MTIPRIALITHALNGGVGSVVFFLRNVLLEQWHVEPDIILVATSSRDGASARIVKPTTWLGSPRIIEESQDGVPYRRVGARWTEFEFQRYRPRRVLTELLNKYDLVQVIGGTPAWAGVTENLKLPVCLFAATLAKEERVTLIRETRGLKRGWFKRMTAETTKIEQHALSSVAYVFAESDYTFKLMSHLVNPGCIQVAPPGVDTRVFIPAESYNTDGYLLCVGRLSDPRKNVRILLDAYKYLRIMNTKIPRLVLAGRGGLAHQDQEYLDSLNLSEWVRIYTDVTIEQLVSLYQNASMFILSSDEEGLGIVILEAMACGLPVVSTDCGGPSTAVVQDETGILVRPKDMLALANAVKHLIQAPELRKKMSQSARQNAEEKFSIKAAGKVYLGKYKQLLGKTG